MTNLSVETDKLIKYWRAGMDEGAEPIVNNLRVLFGRIEELERALIPFARQGVKTNDGLPLTQVYHKDCVTAYNTLSSEVARRSAPQEPEYLPAQHGA